MKRISIATCLAIVAVVAFGLAALVNATDLWLGLTLTLMIGLLAASVLATILRGWRSGGWIGFALFGWSALLIGHTSLISVGLQSHILPDLASRWIFSTANVRPMPPANFATLSPGSVLSTPEATAYFVANEAYNGRSLNANFIGRWLWVLLLAGFGAILGIFLSKSQQQEGIRPDPVESAAVSSLGP